MAGKKPIGMDDGKVYGRLRLPCIPVTYNY